MKKEINWRTPRWKNTLSPEEQEDYVGFVYIIRQKSTQKYYLGKKQYWNKVTKPPLKGRKNKRHGTKESNWKEYWGSSNKLLAEIQKKGTQDFDRQILKHCKSKFDLSYTELEWQIKMNVLFDDKSFNEIINVRLHRCADKDIVEEVESTEN